MLVTLGKGTKTVATVKQRRQSCMLRDGKIAVSNVSFIEEEIFYWLKFNLILPGITTYGTDINRYW